jgi:hypothetical protein
MCAIVSSITTRPRGCCSSKRRRISKAAIQRSRSIPAGSSIRSESDEL